MNESFGRASGPTTEADSPHESKPDIRNRVRDVPPVSHGYGETALSDPDAKPRSVDPLDQHRPGRPTNDPLDPDGHVI